MVKILVCEGECGRPWTKSYDAALKGTFDTVAGTAQRAKALEFGKKLVHTPHTYVGHVPGRRGDTYTCNNCGTARLY